MDIVILFVILLAGITIGHYSKQNAHWLQWTKPLGMLGLFCLIFILGLKIGAEPRVVNHLRTIGLTALVFGVLATGLSALAAAMIVRFLPKGYRK